MKHSKAPYSFEGNKIVCADNYNVATVNSHATSEGRATGALLAAAPDLLEALDVLVTALSDPSCRRRGERCVSGVLFDQFESARRAIAKARGE